MKLKEFTFDGHGLEKMPWLEDLVIEVQYYWKDSYLIANATHLDPAEYSEPEIEFSEAWLVTKAGKDIKLELSEEQKIDFENYLFEHKNQ